MPTNPIRAEALAAENLSETPEKEENADHDPVPVSAAAHAALRALIEQTSSFSLRKTLETLCQTLTPPENGFADSLRADIRHEIKRLVKIPSAKRSEIQKKRLDQLTEALTQLNQSDSDARLMAEELYGHLVR
ncbi:hypothetical protein EVA_07073 [gut metagenome]|uniref:Uncharacterized protein n=1 Tax=gut metagenome TaxID=749906 RepID=J9GQQ3_9ZZZZ